MRDRFRGIGPGRVGSAASETMRKRNFERLSEKRLQDAVSAINRIAGLSSPYNYRYSVPEVVQILHELETAIAELKLAFEIGQKELERMAARRRKVARSQGRK